MKKMKTAIRGSLLVALLLGAGMWALPVHADDAPAETKVRYTKKECVQCHAERVNDIATAGGRHRNVPCVGCHNGHPPEVEKPIAQCSRCHLKTKKAHFEITGCLNCHKNPHTPLKISFKGKDACLNCHGLQQEQFRSKPSKHSALDCSTCHDVHRKVPQCTQCHVPHKGKIVDHCKLCHEAHMPKLAGFPAEAPSKNCGMCHKKAADLLGATMSKHKPFSCEHCHKGRHRTIPACQDCHGTPHPKGIRVKFPKCGNCHNIAHDLNHWPEAEAKKAAEAEAKKAAEEAPKKQN